MAGSRAGIDGEILEYFRTLSNWGRWGSDDQLGTLNLLTPDVVRRATALARDGTVISCARTVSPRQGAHGSPPPMHFMISSGDAAPKEGFGGATDWIGLAFHGHAVTHLDAPSHIFWNGSLYNGMDARAVTTSRGATVGSIEHAARGVVGRGILADIPRFRGSARLANGEAVQRDELDACLTAEGIRAGPGDILVVRTGRDHGTDGPVASSLGDEYPGLHADCLPWLRRNDIAMLVADVPQDVQPSGSDILRYPIHTVGLVAMGMWMLDNAYLEPLAQACSSAARWEFLFTVAPLRLKHGTGSPVNPLAVL